MSPGLTTGGTTAAAVPADSFSALGHIIEGWDDTITFYLNGSKVVLDAIDPEITLLEYLRGIGLTGTKLGCAEGGCGACTVVVSQYNPTTKKLYHASINACLAPLISVDGKHVITVEGIGKSSKPHPVQERIAKWHGSQCGFCTPGIVMSLYALLRNNCDPTAHEVEEAFDGNLCRCTGYRPILDAAQTFSVNSPCSTARRTDEGCCMLNGNGERPADCCRNKKNFNGEVNGPEIPVKRFTPPGFVELKPDTELIFPGQLRNHEFRPLVLGNKRKRWLRPVTTQQLLEIKHALPSAKIIGGSTETQIEIKFKGMKYAISVYVGDIHELRNYSFEEGYLEIGANISLTDLEGLCREGIERYGEVKAQPLAAILKQLRYFAGRQIRNVGTPAGNLVTASPISDLNPVFLATRSTLIARTRDQGEIELPMEGFFTAYRTTSLPPKAILAKIKVPLARDGEYIRTYKQAKRKDDDIAIVTAAMKVLLDEEQTIKFASLAYGGMAPTTVEAKGTINFLTGKKWGDSNVLEGAVTSLEQDFNLNFGVPGGMAVYRKSLALGFFYRFWNEVLVELGDSNADQDATTEIERNISTGKRDQNATVEYEQRVLGKGVPHVAALKQTTGEAQYTDDIPPQRGELYGCLVLSTKAHAKIIRVDASSAMALPGVKAFIDHRNLPSEAANWWGAPVCDEVFFAVDKVFTAGQPIGMIVAETQNQAAAGVRAVQVDYEELPAVLTMEEAIEKESFFQQFRFIKRGQPIDDALESADHRIRGISRMGGQEHFYLETNAVVVIPEEDGEIKIYSSTQSPGELQAHVARATGVPVNRVVVRVKRLGGGFGGKESRPAQLAAIAAVAAKTVKRPIRCMLDRDEDILTSGQRHPFLCQWEIGVNKDGMLVALKANIFANGGWSQDLSGAVVERSLAHIDNCYSIPNIYVTGRICKTNTVSNTAFRGFGGPQGMWITESFMEHAADTLNIPVDKLREMNFYQEGDVTHCNQDLVDWHVPIMWKQLKEETEYERRRQEVDEFNKTHKWKKRGISIIPTKFGISFTALHFNQAGALVHIYRDGSILVAHGGTEMGQGLHTKMTMVVAEALGVPLESVYISETATNTVANASPTAASASSDLNGYAVFDACQQLNERLKPYKEKLGPNATMKELADTAYFDRVNLSAQGYYKTPDIGYDWVKNEGKMYFYFTQGVAVSEVEIDTLTGDWTCLRSDIKMDVGRSINPAIDYGQIEGAFIQGQGLFTTEESLWLRNNGQIFTRGPGSYKIPGFRDIPQIFNISMLKGVEWKNLNTIQRSKGVGEPPLFLSSSVFFAIRDALKSARKDYGCEEILNLWSPATPERIRLSCADGIVRRSYVKPQQGEGSWFIEI